MTTPSGIPDGVVYNGPQNVGTRTLLCFTESVSGGLFTLPPCEATYECILAAATEKRREFQRKAGRDEQFTE